MVPGGGASRALNYGHERHRYSPYAGPRAPKPCRPGNVVDGCPVASLDAQAGERSSGGPQRRPNHYQGRNYGNDGLIGFATHMGPSYGDTGGPSRFFQVSDWSLDVAEQLAQADPVRYEAKASQAERSAGLARRNSHPTVKPISLCTWLATLLLPPAAYAPRRLLVPFCGTGSEMIGGLLAGFEEIVGIEQSAAYCALAEKRLEWWRTQDQPSLWPGAALEPQRPPVPPQTDMTLPLFPPA